MPKKSHPKTPSTLKQSPSPKDLSGSLKIITPRPPIVTLLGHVDHGKTSLLDRVRQTQLTAQEAGGITQSIGAYQVEYQGKKITFIDTPGHEAFTAMRARGGQAADLVVLVVAADDGVNLQTIEAIHHAQAAQVPLLVALNKMDLPAANPQKALQQLAQQGVLTEKMGGEVVAVEVSAKTGQGINELLEMILLLGEMQELKAKPSAKPAGVVLEGWRNEKRGTIVCVLVKEGTLQLGQIIVTASAWGKIKAMSNWQGQSLRQALPGTPVEILGMREVPLSGENFEVAENERKAREKVAESPRLPPLPRSPLSSQKEAGPKILKLIIKADSQGSLEAVHYSLEKLQSPAVKLEYIHKGIGNISEADVMLAAATFAIVLGFRVSIDKPAQNAAKLEKITFRTYEVIYHLLEEVQDVIEGEMQEPEVARLGLCKILEVFVLSDGTRIAGCLIEEGKLARGHQVRIWREDKIIAQSQITSLRIGKGSVDKAKKGQECGLGFKDKIDFAKGDFVESIQS